MNRDEKKNRTCLKCSVRGREEFVSILSKSFRSLFQEDELIGAYRYHSVSIPVWVTKVD